MARKKTPVAFALALLMIAWMLAGCASPQQKEAKLLASGKKFVADKDYAHAVLQFRNAIQAMPRDTEPRYQLALTYLKIGSYAAAAGELRRVIELDPKHIEAKLQLARLMNATQNKKTLEESEKMIQSVLAQSPGNVDALVILAGAEMNLGKSADAVQHLEQALARAPQTLEASLTLARIKMRNGDLAGVKEVLEKACRQTPPPTDAYVALAEYYALTRNLPEAERQLYRALEIDPKNSYGLLDLTRVQLGNGQKQKAEQTLARLSALPDPRYRSMHAAYLFENGQQDAAIAELRKLAKANPHDRSLRSRLVGALVQAGKAAEAEALLAAILKDNPKDTEALYQRAEISLKYGKYADAEKDLTDVLRYQPDSATAHYAMARVQKAQGRVFNERQHLAEAMRLDPNMVRARIDLSQLLLQQNDPKAALAVMNDRLPVEQKLLPGVIAQRNWALLASGDKAEARRALEEELPAVKSSDLLLQKALLDISDKKFAEARTSLEQMLKQNPEDLHALEALTLSYTVDQQAATALQKVRAYAGARPKSAPLQLFLGNWLSAAGKLEEARAAYQAAKQANPNLIAADMALARLDMVEKNYNDARRILSGIVSRDDKNADANLGLGMVEQLSGNKDTAMQYYRKVVAADPKNVVALNNLAALLSNTPDPNDEALKYAQQAIAINPEAPAVLDTVGFAYYKKGIYPTAVKYLESSVAKDGTALRRYHLAMAYLKAGQQARGREALQVALKMNPDLPEAKIAQDILANPFAPR